MAISFDQFIPTASGFSSFLGIIIVGTIIIALITIGSILIRNKVKYVYVAEIYRRRQEDQDEGVPQAKVVTGKAGYFNSRGRVVFRVKYGMMPWQQIELTKIPDPKYMVDNKVYYAQLQKDNYVQMKCDIDWAGEFKLKPIEDDLKYGAQLDFLEKSNILKTESSWQKYGGPITLGLILVAGIIAMYFQTKACSV